MSVVIPIYNEIEGVDALLEELLSVLAPLGDGVEIVLVDDGSTDGTRERLHDWRKKDARITLVEHECNVGQSAAMLTGFQFAAAETLVTLDGDGQSDPRDVFAVLKAMQGADVVCGIRARRRDSVWRRWGSRLANAVRNRLTGEHLADICCPVKGLRKSQVTRLKYFNGIHRFLPTLLRLEGATVVEIPVNHRPRARGKSKYTNLGRLLVTWQDVLAVRWMIRRHRRIVARRIED
ncbi:glycosyltransferase family 2 protein [bacterium]|nr:glycosyltransferase family 2 protein [bacterium]